MIGFTDVKHLDERTCRATCVYPLLPIRNPSSLCRHSPFDPMVHVRRMSWHSLSGTMLHWYGPERFETMDTCTYKQSFHKRHNLRYQ